MTSEALRLAAVLLALLPALWAAPAAAALSAQDREDIARVEAYLNGLTSLEARFAQLDASGEAATGKLLVRRPGRLRFDYDPPNPILLVSPGSKLIHYDRDLKTATWIDWEDTPAWFLLAEKVTLDGPYRVVDVAREPGRITVTAVKADAPEEGRVAVTFADRPDTLALSGWVATDGLGQPTRVTLFDMAENRPIDDEAFAFDEPISALEQTAP